jgi:hypothetical protein
MINRLSNPDGVPDAPFKKTWHELAMKRILHLAAHDGYDRVTWNTGEQHAARYDMSQHVNAIHYIPHDDGTYDVWPANEFGGSLNDELDKQHLTPDQVREFVGHDIAQKIFDRQGDLTDSRFIPEGEAPAPSAERRLEGVDLKMGGDGMKGFYDRMLPAFMNKYVKKWGSRVEPAIIHTKPEYQMQYQGPDYSAAQLRAIGHERYQELSAALNHQLNDLVAHMHDTGDRFQAAMEHLGSPALAEALGGRRHA